MELLGADLAYLGTRFIASQESMADPRYKRMLVDAGLDPDAPPAGPNGAALPATAKPWKTVWSAGQGVDLIHDVPTVVELVLRLRREYVAACTVPEP